MTPRYAQRAEEERVISTTTARSTRTIVQVVHRWEPSERRMIWETICMDHGGVCSHDTRALATRFRSAPEEWCPYCQEDSTTTVEVPEDNRRMAERGLHYR